MTQKFIYLGKNFPEKNQKDEIELIIKDSDLVLDEPYSIIAIPIKPELYNKRLIEASMNLNVELIGNLTRNKKGFDAVLTDQGININIVHMLQCLGNFTGYFINSTSWRNQKIEDFDRDELKSRLQKVIQLL